MQFSKRAARGISIGLLAFYGNAISLPAQAAVRQEVFGRFKPGTEGSTPKSSLEQMRELTRTLKMGETSLAAAPVNGAMNALKSLVGNDPTSKRIALEKQTATSIIGLQAALAQQSAEQLQELSANSAHIKAKNLPAVIQQRQADAIALLQSRQQQLQSSLDQLVKAQTNNDDSQRQQALTTLSQQLEDWGGAKQAKTDFKHLPWGSPSSTVRAPISAANIKAMSLQRFNLKQGQYTFNPSLLAQNNTNKDPSQMTPQQLWDNATPTVFNSKTSIGQWQQIAYSGMTTSNQNQWPVLASLPAAVQPADTAANDDAQITPAIQTLATTLHHNPAEIYKWVYDNIEYIPTYGSIQGSDMTLQTKRGNAFDTSSLLISLLRASGIPARYVYGTIDVNPTIMKDWVGGVNNVDAALNLMGQGGIPSIALSSGSQVTAVRMEHVWVEANLNFNPARGGVQKGATNQNSSTTWIPLDASYKTHTRTAGMNLAQAVPFDADTIVSNALQGTIVDNSNGSVQNINLDSLKSSITNYQNKVTDYFSQTKPSATFGDVFGGGTINTYRSQMLSPTLPYVVNAVVSDYVTLPDALKSFFIANVYEEDGNTLAFNVKLSTSSLKGQPLAISFGTSSQDDESVIDSFIPNPHADGTPIKLSELPTSLPGYLINLTPSITLNGTALRSGGSFKMGSKVSFEYGFQTPDGHNAPISTKQLTSGDYYAIGYSLQGVSKQQLLNVQAVLSQTKSILDSKDPLRIEGLNKHNISGALLQTSILSYFALNENQDKIAAGRADMVSNPYMSYGTFSTNLSTVFNWGVPTKVVASGMLMDVNHISNSLVEKGNDKTKTISYNLARGGVYSLNENLVPESLFNSPSIGADPNFMGYSAVKILGISSAQGQKIFTIDKNNINSILPQLHHTSTTIQAISDAVSSGKIVTISEDEITDRGWTGAGYTVIDQDTGAGGYMVEGANGAFEVGYSIGATLYTALNEFVNVKGDIKSLAKNVITGAVDEFALGALGPVIFAVLVVLAIYIARISSVPGALACLVNGFFDGFGLTTAVATRVTTRKEIMNGKAFAIVYFISLLGLGNSTYNDASGCKGGS
jgi:hypothetical protein